ncbi:hypothetical protein V6N13_004811 [Hibiscus sabdariffa]|uniref:Uncharacterized protein n=1 Tax=Hibiscus sabdariffa TaxID=183260 RepID=A0ABR2RZW3_9ROSI
MAPSRPQSNGRSPLASKLNPNPKPNHIPSKSPSPTTPSPLRSSLKKPLLVIGQSPASSPPSSTNKTFGNEVVEKRVRAYWASDKAWYGDAEEGEGEGEGEEELDLVEETRGRFKRLRRGGSRDDEDEDAAENVNKKSMDSDVKQIMNSISNCFDLPFHQCLSRESAE